jgi:hypothetical protein
MSAHIVFPGSDFKPVVTKLESFTVTQNNRSQVIHIADYKSLRGRDGQITLLNGVEATMNGARYVKAQSKTELCAKLVLDEPEASVDTEQNPAYNVGS